MRYKWIPKFHPDDKTNKKKKKITYKSGQKLRWSHSWRGMDSDPSVTGLRTSRQRSRDVLELNTQHYKVRFKGKVEQSWEWSRP